MYAFPPTMLTRIYGKMVYVEMEIPLTTHNFRHTLILPAQLAGQCRWSLNQTPFTPSLYSQKLSDFPPLHIRRIQPITTLFKPDLFLPTPPVSTTHLQRKHPSPAPDAPHPKSQHRRYGRIPPAQAQTAPSPHHGCRPTRPPSP